MNILALDTSTEACSVALSAMDEVRVDFRIMPRGHARHILAMVDAVLAEAGLTPADLDVVAYGRGPGSFTGVRIGTGVAQGIAFGADLPVAAISTLAALAQGAVRRHGASRILAAIDARMGEVYWAGFEVDENGLVREVLAEAVSSPERVAVTMGRGGASVPGGAPTGMFWQSACRNRSSGRIRIAFPVLKTFCPWRAKRRSEGHLVSADQATPIISGIA